MPNKLFKVFREPINGLTHFAGTLFAIAGLVILIFKSINPLKPWHLVSYSIFGSGMILLYTASTLYHWLPLSEKGIEQMRKVDHMMIFILIAATYTPICLIPLRGSWGWSLFGSIWGLAVLGIVLKFFRISTPRWLYTTVYLFMGWLAVVAIFPLFQSLQTDGLIWIFIGGFFYSSGAVIYALKKPNPFTNVFGFHEIWHIFVMLGTFSHFWVMYKYVSAL